MGLQYLATHRAGIDRSSGSAGRLELRGLVPEGVVQEVSVGPTVRVTAETLAHLPFTRVMSDRRPPERILAWDLGRGETQVLSQALSQPGCGVILDDRAARRCASTLQLTQIGTVGLVALARRRGLAPEAKPILNRLREKGLFISSSLMEAVLTELGEGHS